MNEFLLCLCIYLSDTSPVDQRPSSPEEEEDPGPLQTEQDCGAETIATISPSRETVDPPVDPTADSLSEPGSPEVPDTNPEPSAHTVEVETVTQS